MTLAEWADLPEDEPGELVDGRIEQEEVASPVHELLAAALLRTLGNWVVPRGGVVLGSAAKYAVRPPGRGRMPDVARCGKSATHVAEQTHPLQKESPTRWRRNPPAS
jgi:hypothetical protein